MAKLDRFSTGGKGDTPHDHQHGSDLSAFCNDQGRRTAVRELRNLDVGFRVGLGEDASRNGVKRRKRVAAVTGKWTFDLADIPLETQCGRLECGRSALWCGSWVELYILRYFDRRVTRLEKGYVQDC